MELGADDIHSLQHALVEEDESVRARAHLELGRIALTMARTEAAARHLREALALDERLHEARALLNDLERRAVAAVPETRLTLRGLAARLLSRLRLRRALATPPPQTPPPQARR